MKRIALVVVSGLAAVLPAWGDDDEPPGPSPQPGRRPFMDFSQGEFEPFTGLVMYSSGFEADPEPCGGVFFRVPVPGIWERLGAFAELGLTAVDRDIDSLADKSGTVLFIAAGIDASVHRGPSLSLEGQVGVAHVDYGGVDDLEDGVGFLVGARGGWSIAKGLRVVYNPQFVLGDDSEWNFFHLVGLSIEF
jgi:hypothetical protein